MHPEGTLWSMPPNEEQLLEARSEHSGLSEGGVQHLEALALRPRFRSPTAPHLPGGSLARKVNHLGPVQVDEQLRLTPQGQRAA